MPPPPPTTLIHDGSQAGTEVAELLRGRLACAVQGALPDAPAALAAEMRTRTAVLVISGERDGSVTRAVRKLLRGLQVRQQGYCLFMSRDGGISGLLLPGA
jgi:hypothetical protein